MKGFALDSGGDLILENNQIQMIGGNDLIRQTVEKVIATNKKEWFLNLEEGINFRNLLGKHSNEELIRNEIAAGLLQVDSSFFIDVFSCQLDKANRKISVYFQAKNKEGNIIEVEDTFG